MPITESAIIGIGMFRGTFSHGARPRIARGCGARQGRSERELNLREISPIFGKELGSRPQQYQWIRLARAPCNTEIFLLKSYSGRVLDAASMLVFPKSHGLADNCKSRLSLEARNKIVLEIHRRLGDRSLESGMVHGPSPGSLRQARGDAGLSCNEIESDRD